MGLRKSKWVNIMNIQNSILIIAICLSSTAVLWLVDSVLDSRDEIKWRTAHDEFVIAGSQFRNSLDAIEKIDSFRKMMEWRQGSNINFNAIVREIGRPDILTEYEASYRIRVNRLIDVYMSVSFDHNGKVILWGQDNEGECTINAARCKLDEELCDLLCRKDISHFEVSSASIVETADCISNLLCGKGLNIVVRYCGTNESRRVSISQSMASFADLIDCLCVQTTADAKWNVREDGKTEILIVPWCPAL